jgi:hypothetical protein
MVARRRPRADPRLRPQVDLPLPEVAARTAGRPPADREWGGRRMASSAAGDSGRAARLPRRRRRLRRPSPGPEVAALRCRTHSTSGELCPGRHRPRRPVRRRQAASRWGSAGEHPAGREPPAGRRMSERPGSAVLRGSRSGPRTVEHPARTVDSPAPPVAQARPVGREPPPESLPPAVPEVEAAGPRRQRRRSEQPGIRSPSAPGRRGGRLCPPRQAGRQPRASPVPPRWWWRRRRRRGRVLEQLAEPGAPEPPARSAGRVRPPRC